jgi:Tol biopolymer transport system component/predicted Ser/Thr protein kinase
MVGRTISHYKILAKLGEGGMGVVYKAEDTRLGRAVALKFLMLNAGTSPDERTRFEREARAAASLDHPNICTVYEIDEAEGRPFIAMAFLEGDTVQQLAEKGPLTVDDVLELGMQAAKGLAAAHEKDIVHRDIKSANLMIVRATSGSEPQLKIMDFGLAQLAAGASKLTQDGSTLGTAAYMSPEQARGDKVDQRSDVWSLGVVLYEMLTGQMPYRGEYQQAVIYSILHEEPTPITALRTGVDLELERIVFKALQKDGEDRYQSALDLLVDLRSLKKRRDAGVTQVSQLAFVTSAMAVAAPAAPMPEPVSRSAATAKPQSPPRRYGLLAAAALVLILLGVVAANIWRSGPPGARSEPPRVIPLTSDAGTETFATFSPDGSQVAFVWDGPNQDNLDVYVRLVEGGQPLRLTSTPAPDSGPTWSPDGRSIAFVRHEVRRSAVYLIPPIGGAERKVADVRIRGQDSVNRHLGWSPDGKTLAVTQQGAGPPRPGPPEGRERQAAPGLRKGAGRLDGLPGPGGIGLYSVDSGDVRRLSLPEPGGEWRPTIHSPTFSPDGTHIAFVRTAGPLAGDIFVRAVDGDGDPRRVTNEENRIQGLTWDDDGFLIFSSDREGAGRLWKTRPVPAGGRIVPVLSAGENALLPAVSKQGRRLAYTRSERDLNVWKMDVGHGPEMMEPKAVIASTRMDHSPQFSPDGARIAFVSDRSGSAELWVANADGSNGLKLTSYDGPIITAPTWSPDGREIAFQVIQGSHFEVDVVAADGAAPRRLTMGDGGGFMPFWSRDGEWIYVNQREAGLCKIPARGGEIVHEPLVIAQDGSYAQESRDGTLLYFSKRGFGGGLWSVPVAGGTPRRLPREVMPAGRGRWVVTDKGIFFVDRERNLKLYHVDSGELETVVTIEPEAMDYPGASFSVSPDGMYVLYVRVDRSEADLMMVENYR